MWAIIVNVTARYVLLTNICHTQWLASWTINVTGADICRNTYAWFSWDTFKLFAHFNYAIEIFAVIRSETELIASFPATITCTHVVPGTLVSRPAGSVMVTTNLTNAERLLRIIIWVALVLAFIIACAWYLFYSNKYTVAFFTTRQIVWATLSFTLFLTLVIPKKIEVNLLNHHR